MMRILKILVSAAAILLALAIFSAGPGTRLGIWDYGTGLSLIRNLALPVMIVAGFSLLALIAAIFTARTFVPLTLIATLMAGAAAFIPFRMGQLFDANPFIHDITTDFENPPEIVAAADLPRKNPPEYLGDKTAPRSEMTVAEAQRKAFPDIEPMMVNGGVDDTAQTVRNIVHNMGMEILHEGTAGDGWTVEAAHTSMWFGFIDDFVVRMTPEGPKTRVDVRSQSRVGGSDLGANAERVRDFMARLEARTS